MIPALLTTLALLAPPAGPAPPAGDLPAAAAMHVGSYGSSLCARVDRTGAIDFGAGVLRFVDGNGGGPIRAPELSYGPGPMLWVTWYTVLDDVVVSFRVLATPAARGGVQRALVAVRVAAENPGAEDVKLSLGARLTPGGGAALRRPLPSLPFEEGARFERDDGWILRDGKALLSWRGPDPDVAFHGPATAPDQLVASLDWKLDLPAGEARVWELYLAGPERTDPGVDPLPEEQWRATLGRQSFDLLAERLLWQAQFHGAFGEWTCGEPDLPPSMVAWMHQLRCFGEAHDGVTALSDRPYGHPASDVAAEAAINGLLVEWGFEGIAASYLDPLLQAEQGALAGLPPERRVAWAHGLARAVRLGGKPDEARRLADAIERLAGVEAALEPWLDPERVRADFIQVLQMAGRDPEGKLPRLSWGAVEQGTTQARMQAVRRGLSAGDAVAAWTAFRGLLHETGPDLVGCMDPGGEPDGTWPLAMMTLARDLLVDDHGPDLHLLPGTVASLVPEVGGVLEAPVLATRFGLLGMQEFRGGLGGRKMQFDMMAPLRRRARAIYVHPPGDLRVVELKHPYFCDATLQEDGTVLMVRQRKSPRRISFEMVVEPRQP